MNPGVADRNVLEGFDPLSLDFVADPYPVLERARRERPVFYYPPLDVWVLTRYDDIAAAAGDFQTFSSRAIGLVPPPKEFVGRVPEDPMEEAFIAMDPPRHTVSRKSANKAFTRGRVAAMEETVVQMAAELIDAIERDGAREADLMTRYCYPLLLRVIVRLLGAPLEMAEDFRRWTEDFMALLSPSVGGGEHQGPSKPMSTQELRARWSGIAEGHAYYTRFVEERLTEPRDDLVSAMLHAVGEDGRPALSPERVITHMTEMIAAGNETTANQIGLMVQLFDRHPEQLQALREDPSLWANAIEEGMRRRSSGVGSFRVTTRAVDVSGVTLPERSLVYLLWLSAGHDEDYFPDPRRFDVRRENAGKHLTLGRGRHLCMGSPLARLVARVGLQSLYDRLPELRVVPDQPLSFQPNLTTIVLRHLEVSW